MVDIVNTAAATPLRITVRPNSAVNGKWHAFVLLLVVPVFSAVGIGFALIGAWPVLPCLLIVMLALVVALRHIERHAEDFERITLNDDVLTVDRHAPDQDEHMEFNSRWVQVVSLDSAPGETRYLALRSHGRELPVGHDLTDTERATVGGALRSRLSRLRR